MEVDFAGKTLEPIDKLTAEIIVIIVFVTVLTYSQYIFAERMSFLLAPQWIEVNNHVLSYFGGILLFIITVNRQLRKTKTEAILI